MDIVKTFEAMMEVAKNSAQVVKASFKEKSEYQYDDVICIECIGEDGRTYTFAMRIKNVPEEDTNV